MPLSIKLCCENYYISACTLRSTQSRVEAVAAFDLAEVGLYSFC